MQNFPELSTIYKEASLLFLFMIKDNIFKMRINHKFNLTRSKQYLREFFN